MGEQCHFISLCFKRTKIYFTLFSLAVIVTTLYIPENILHKAPPAHEFISPIPLVGLMAAGGGSFYFNIFYMITVCIWEWCSLPNSAFWVKICVSVHRKPLSAEAVRAYDNKKNKLTVNDHTNRIFSYR